VSILTISTPGDVRSLLLYFKEFEQNYQQVEGITFELDRLHGVEQDKWEALFEQFRGLPNLRMLGFENSVVLEPSEADQTLLKILPSLSLFPQITTLKLCGNFFSSCEEVRKALAVRLSRLAPNLTVLDLSRNPLRHYLWALTRVLPHLEQLKTLRLSSSAAYIASSGTRAEAVRSLFGALSGLPITTLDLSDNAPIFYRRLESLDYPWGESPEEQIEAFVEGLSNMSNLEILHLSGNIEAKRVDGGVRAFVGLLEQILPRLPKLTKLHLNNNGLSERVIEAIEEYLRIPVGERPRGALVELISQLEELRQEEVSRSPLPPAKPTDTCGRSTFFYVNEQEQGEMRYEESKSTIFDPA